MTSIEKIPVGMSACLLGHNVRYDGGHKRSRYCIELLEQVFQFHPFCPEVEIGMGVPREAIRLVGDHHSPRARGTKNHALDVTEPLTEVGQRIGELSHNFSGYILMQKSPSCGLFSAKVYSGDNVPPKKRAGLFAEALHDAHPQLPLEEEGRLHDPVLRENFILRVHIYHTWQTQVLPSISASALIEFHSRHKLILMSHSQQAYRRLGQMIAQLKKVPLAELAQNYITDLMNSLAKPANRRGHTNVLYHILGYLKQIVPGAARQELVTALESYRLGHSNLAVPIALLNHYVQLYASEYIKQQVYLNPYTNTLGLRNEL